MLKKILACLLLISVLAIGFCACGDEEGPAVESSDAVTDGNTTESSNESEPSGGEGTQTPSGGEETNTPSGGDETGTPGSDQKPNEVFDPSEGEDTLVGDNNWTGIY